MSEEEQKRIITKKLQNEWQSQCKEVIRSFIDKDKYVPDSNELFVSWNLTKLAEYEIRLQKLEKNNINLD